jgi:glycosyltransferase involved in cell wall biosynthesis
MAKFLFFDHKVIKLLLKDDHASGGAAVQTMGWVHGLLDNGHEVKILTDYRNGDELKEQYVNVDIIPSFDPSKGVKWLRWFTHRFPDAYRKIKNANPDYVYESIPNWGSYFLGSICRLLKIKYVLRVSNDSFLDDRVLKSYSKFDRYFLMKGLGNADIILCQNDYQYSVIRKNFPGKRVYKIGNPIYVHKPEEYERSGERDYIAWAGLFQYQKNLKLLYQIAEALPHETFKVAGSPSSKADEETRTYLEKLKELPNVELVGFLDRKSVLSFFSKSKFLLNTSRFEGFSNTFLEAMAMGTPILTSEAVNPDGIISKYKLGIVYKDASHLREQWGTLAQENYQELSARVMDFVSENHDYRTVADKLVKLLEGNESVSVSSEVKDLDRVIVS